MAGKPLKQRSFAEIISEQKSSRNILEIRLTKNQVTDSDGNVTKPKNISFDELGAFIFDVLKIPAKDCLRYNFITARYDTKEIMLKPGVDMTPFLGTREYLGHIITVTKQRNNVTKVVFKNVPLNIPDEEIINLCEVYGRPLDYVVHYEKMHNVRNKDQESGIRYVEMDMFPGAAFNNFYWLEGPLVGDVGARVTVLHPGQIQQCSNCLRLASKGCPGNGNGKACEALGTSRQRMDCYMTEVKHQHGYISLKAKYYSQFPAIGGAGNFGINEIVGSEEDDEVVPINPIKERDAQIAALMASLEVCRKEISDINLLRDEVNKTKSELKAATKEANLVKKKMNHARKVTEQRMANTLTSTSTSTDEEDALVSLYSSLVDEDDFILGDEDDTIAPKNCFLTDVEEHLGKAGSEEGKMGLSEMRNKILERVKGKKIERRQRRESFGSVSSLGSQKGIKRSNNESAGGDSSRARPNAAQQPNQTQIPGPWAKPNPQTKP